MAQPQDIMQLLDELQFGATPENTNNAPSSLIRKPPESDSRVKAIQRYMEMKGAGRIPTFGTPKEIGPGNRTRPMNKNAQREMKSDIGEVGRNDYDDRTGNDYFVDPKDAFHPSRRSDVILEEMSRPVYSDSRGRPSPHERDESLMDMIGNKIGQGVPIKAERKYEPLPMRDFWGEDHKLVNPDLPPYDRDKQNEMLNPGEKERSDHEIMDAFRYYKDLGLDI